MTKRQKIILLIAILALIVSVILYLFVFDVYNEMLVNTMFEVKGHVLASGQGYTLYSQSSPYFRDIIIIGIDEKTLASGKYGRFPFPRTAYVDLLEKISKEYSNGIYPEIIFFDIIFSEYSQKEIDEKFFDALKKFPNIYVDYLMEKLPYNLTYKDIASKKQFQILTQRFSIPLDDPRIKNREEVKKLLKDIKKSPEQYLMFNPPLPEVVSYVEGVGLANLAMLSENFKETRGRVPLLVKYGNNYYPHIALLIVLKYLGITMKDVEVHAGKKIVLKNAKLKIGRNKYKVVDVEIPVENPFYNYMTVNFKDRAFLWGGTIGYVSFIDVIEKDIDPRSFDKRVVMVGATALGLGDIHKTPLGIIYGIEVIANEVNTILERCFIYFTPSWVYYLLAFIFSIFFVGFLIPKLRISLGVVVWLSLLLGAIALQALLFINANVIFLSTLPIISLISSFIGVEAYIAISEQLERLKLKTMLDSYVSPEVVNILLKHPEMLNLGGIEREITVMFSDIRGFTSMSEGMRPEELVSFLNTYLSKMTDIVMLNNGTLDKYIGDAIMAFWGAPLEQPEHAFLACKTAIEMKKALEDFNKELPPEKHLEIGIGINTGIATIGNIGSEKRKNYTAMGDTVNLASRLEGVNKVFHTTIIISEYTYEKVKGRVLVRELDVVRVKGKRKPVKIFELLELRENVEELIKSMGLDFKDLEPTEENL